MITIKIECLASLLGITGKRRDEVQVTDGYTVKELLHTLSERYGSRFKKVVSGENPYIVFMINGQSIHEHGLETKLEHGDSILMGILAACG